MKISKKNKKAKFYCESCGSEVSEKAKVCTNCGKFFCSVRCPKCGNTGSTEEFRHGCPQCGYAVSGNSYIKNKSNSSGEFLQKIFNGRNFKSSSYQKTAADSSLPFWIYIIAIAALAGVIILLYSCL